MKLSCLFFFLIPCLTYFLDFIPVFDYLDAFFIEWQAPGALHIFSVFTAKLVELLDIFLSWLKTKDNRLCFVFICVFQSSL